MGIMDSLKQIKELEMQMTGPIDKSHVDGTFYYDESNNFRKFRLRSSGFNNDINSQSHFSLGGIFVPNGCKPNIDELITKLKPQKNQKKFKFKFFSYNQSEFKDFLNSKRLSVLFDWILKNGLLIHMSSLDYLYFSLVDIVDELPDANITGVNNRPLKDILYSVVRKDVDSFIKILYKYKYPNVKKTNIFDFYKEVYNFYVANYDYDNSNPDDFSKEMLRQILKSGFRREGNGFIQNNEDYVLHEKYEMIYINNPYNFLNCKHIFDEEPDIVEKLEKIESNYAELFNMTFVKSETDIFVQLSDAIAGFSAKLDSMIFNHSFTELSKFVESLEGKQVKLIYDYLRLVVKSDHFCILFTHATVPELYRRKYRHLLQEVAKVIQK